MIRAIVDTNVFIADQLTEYSNGSCSRVIQGIFNGDYHYLTSVETLSELQSVLSESRLLHLHGKSRIEIAEFCAGLKDLSEVVTIGEKSIEQASNMIRDVTDRKFLELALESRSDFLVTNDRRHLLPLKKIGLTKIITPHKFLMAMRNKR